MGRTFNAPSRPQKSGDVAEVRLNLAVADFIAARNGRLPGRPQYMSQNLRVRQSHQRDPAYRIWH